jgi:hypothetical protein
MTIETNNKMQPSAVVEVILFPRRPNVELDKAFKLAVICAGKT